MGISPFEADHGETLFEIPEEFVGGFGLNGASAREVLALDIADGGGNGDACFDRRPFEGFAGENAGDAVARNPPFGGAAVGGESGLEMAGTGAVLVADEAADNAAEALDVEIGVLQLERIESPFDEIDSLPEGFLALLELEHAADAVVAIAGEDAQHVAMDV